LKKKRKESKDEASISRIDRLLTLQKTLYFFTGKFNKKIPNLDRHKKKRFHHFGQVDFDMSVVIKVVFLLDHLIGHFDY